MLVQVKERKRERERVAREELGILPELLYRSIYLHYCVCVDTYRDLYEYIYYTSILNCHVASKMHSSAGHYSNARIHTYINIYIHVYIYIYISI